MKKSNSLINNKNSIHVEYLILGGLLTITVLSGIILNSTKVNADDDSVIDTVNITVPVSCTMSGNIDTAHNATLNNGTYSGASGSEYENGIGKTTLTTFCNDQNGFSIYAIGYTGDEAGNTNLVGTAVSGNATIATGTATSGSTSNWAMKVNKVTDSSTSYNPANMTITNSFDNYKAVPDEYTKVAEYHAQSGSSATDTILGAKVETTYAAYISSTQIADTYSGQVKYVMVHPYDAAAPTDITPPTSCTTPVQGVTYMQEMATMSSSEKAAVLSSMTEDAQYYLADNRDNKSYCVAKLKDGNIWMTQNLDFNITNSGANLNSANTDVPSDWPDAGNLVDTYATDDTSWNYDDNTPESYDPGDLYWSGVLDDSTPLSTGNSHYHLGNFYNWTAAVAMSDSSSLNTEYQDANQSICPAGWMLPKNGNSASNGSFRYLIEQYGWDDSSSWMENPFIWDSAILLPLSGYLDGSLYGIGNNANYLSSIVNDSDYVYVLSSDSGGYVNPDYYSGYRDLGFSIRCLTR